MNLFPEKYLEQWKKIKPFIWSFWINFGTKLVHVGTSLNTDKPFSFHYRIEYFDDLAKEEGSPVDDTFRTTWEPAAIAHKNLLIDGMQILCDEFSRPTHQTPSRMYSSDSYQQVWSTTVSCLMLDVHVYIYSLCFVKILNEESLFNNLLIWKFMYFSVKGNLDKESLRKWWPCILL